MDVEDFPPPPPDLLDDEDEGERFEFDDSGDEVPEADRPPPEPEGISVPPPCSSSVRDAPVNEASPNPEHTFNAEADLPPPPQDFPANNRPLAEALFKSDLPPLPPPPPTELCPGAAEGRKIDLNPPAEGTDVHREQDENKGASVVCSSKPKVSPYSVIDIGPIQQQLPSEQSGPPSSPSANQIEGVVQEVSGSPGLSSGYSVPVPCGYATPSNVPVIPPTYTTPVLIRHFSMDEDGKERHFPRLFLFYLFVFWDRALP